MRRYLVSLLLVLAVCLTLPSLTLAQGGTPPPTQIIGGSVTTADTIVWDHNPAWDMAPPDHYILVTDGARTDLGPVARITPTATVPGYSIPFPALAPGNHVIVIEAAIGDARSGPSNELQVVVVILAPPSNVRLGRR